jgi:hypothetical protein
MMPYMIALLSEMPICVLLQGQIKVIQVRHLIYSGLNQSTKEFVFRKILILSYISVLVDQDAARTLE